MEGLKPMADKAMGIDYKACVQCGNPIEPGNTGTVCGACTQSMLGMTTGMDGSVYAASNPNDYGASNLTPNSHVGLNINGHNLNVNVYRSLQGLADDITNSMLPGEVNMLVRLLSSEAPTASNVLPAAFWDAIDDSRKISAIKELRAASTLNLKSSKDIVDAIMNKPEPEPEDKPEDKDDSGEPEESEPEGADDPDFDQYPDDYDAEEGESDGEADGADAGEGDAEGDGDDNGQDGSSNATADALADLARKAHDNGKNHSEDEIRAALETLGIQF